MPSLPPSSNAQFRRPRRASQAQRKAARDLGRKRKGKSRDQWRGLALAGAGAVAIGGTALAAHQVQKKREGMIRGSNERLDAAKDAKPEGYKGLSKDQRSRAIEARKAQLFGAEWSGYDEDVGAQIQRISVPSLLGAATKRSIQEKGNTDTMDVRSKIKSSLLGEAMKAEARSGDNRGRTKKAVRRATARIRPSDFFARLRLARFAQHSSSGDMTMNNYAEFRGPRRSSQKHRQAMRKLGRKRRGRSSDKWKGLALAGAAGLVAAPVGVAALGAYGRKRREAREAAANTASPEGGASAGGEAAANTASPQGRASAGGGAGGGMPSSGQANVPQKSRQRGLPGTSGQRALPGTSGSAGSAGSALSLGELVDINPTDIPQKSRQRALPGQRGLPGTSEQRALPGQRGLPGTSEQRALPASTRKQQNSERVQQRRARLGFRDDGSIPKNRVVGKIAKTSPNTTSGRRKRKNWQRNLRNQVDNWRKQGDYRRSAYRTARFARQSSRSITLDIRYFL